jgi:hypothetical protein
VFAQAPVLASLLAPVAAQSGTFVAPSGHGYERIAGEGSDPDPFGAGPSRTAQLFARSRLGFASGTIVELAWRRDAGGTGYAGGTARLVVRLAHSDAEPDTMPYRFSRLPNGPATEVFRGDLVLPAAPAGPAPHGFAAAVPLATPFAFASSGGDLLVEIVADNLLPSAWGRDARSVQSGVPGTFRALAPPCPNSTGFALTSRPTNLSNCAPGRNMEIWAAGTLRTSSTVLHFLGPALPRPLDLTAIGAPGCVLGVDPLVVMPPVAVVPATFEFGYAYVEHRLPAALGLVGARLAWQWAELDLPANALGAVFSDTVEVTLGTPPSSHGTQTLRTGLAGSDHGTQRDAEHGAITRFTVR